MRHHWFFDLDGTLARTGEDIIAAWKQSLADLGRECPHFDEVFTIGPTLDKVVYDLFDDASPELVAQMVARFRPNYDESGFPNTVPYPGVPEWLRSLKAAGARQRHIDQAQSMNLYITNDYTMRRLLNLYVQAWKEGVKTIYYVRSKSLEVEECESCAS